MEDKFRPKLRYWLHSGHQKSSLATLWSWRSIWQKCNLDLDCSVLFLTQLQHEYQKKYGNFWNWISMKWNLLRCLYRSFHILSAVYLYWKNGCKILKEIVSLKTKSFKKLFVVSSTKKLSARNMGSVNIEMTI